MRLICSSLQSIKTDCLNLRHLASKTRLSLFLDAWAFGFLIFFLLLVPQVQASENLERLDRIVQNSGGLQTFLSNHQLQDQYFLALQDYYGATDHSNQVRFSRKSFDAIVSLLKRLISKYPEIKAELEFRLFDADGLGNGFSLQVEEGGHGVKFDSAVWKQTLQLWFERLKAGAKLQADSSHTLSRINQKADALGDLGLIHQSTSPEHSRLFVELKNDPAIISLANQLIYDFLHRADVMSRLTSHNSDETLFLLGSMRRNPRFIFESAQISSNLKSVLSSVAKKLIASPEQLEKSAQVLSKSTIISNQGVTIPLGSIPGGKYQFLPLPRRIHGLWKGVTFKECIGGSCEPGKRPHVERILTVILRGAQIYNLEINGSYRGFVQIVPIERQGRRFGSVDFSAFPLRNHVTVFESNSETGERQAQTKMLFDFWFQQAMLLKSNNIEGFVVGTGRSVNNANVVEAVHNSPYFIFGENVGAPETFHTNDPWQDLLPELQSRHGDARDIGGRMVFDAMMAGQRELTLLKFISESEVSEFIADEQRVQEFFESVSNIARKSGLAHLIADRQVQNPKIQKILVAELVKDRKRKVDSWGDVLYREELQRSLLKLTITDSQVISNLIAGLKKNIDNDLALRIHTILISKFAENADASSALAAMLSHPDSVVRQRALRSYSSIHSNSTRSTINKCANIFQPKFAPRFR